MAQTETALDATLTAWLAIALPRDAVAFHVPNGGYRLGHAAAAMLKRAGLVAGVPDRCILWQGRALFVEIKRPGRPARYTAGQREMFPRFAAAGFPVSTVTGIEELAAVLTAAGIPLRNKGD